MHTDERNAMTSKPLAAGFGALAFGAMTLAASFISDVPGGGYTSAQVAGYVSRGERASQLLAIFLAMCALPGLICMLAHIRDALATRPEHRRASSLIWGSGIAAAACFAIGWGVDGGQLLAHFEGGSAIVIPPAVTYLIAEIGVVFIFGCGAMLLGFALVTLMVSSRGLLPTWLRRLTLVFGLCGIAGLAWATFFVLLLGTAVIGAWLIAAARTETSHELAVEVRT
jgi:hypothetical protein